MTKRAPHSRLPELRALIEIARRYSAGDVHYSYVCNAVDALREALRYSPCDPRIKSLAQEWESMAIRLWPEMLQISNPVSEPEFMTWVQTQLVVFESEDLDKGQA